MSHIYLQPWHELFLQLEVGGLYFIEILGEHAWIIACFTKGEEEGLDTQEHISQDQSSY